MFIDADTHISPTSENGGSITAEQLIDLMDQAGIDRCLTWVHPPYIKTRLNASVEYVAQSMKKYPDRIMGFGWIDPSLGMDNAIELTNKCMNDYHMFGIKLNGSQNKFYVDDPEITYPLIRIVEKANGIVAFHSGCDDVDHTHPYRVAKVARDFPNTQFIMIHMGGESYFDVSSSAIEAAQENPNITLVGSEVSKRSVLKAISVLGPSRVAYASDTPFGIMCAEVAAYKSMLKYAGLDEREIDMVMGGNIARVLKLN